MRFESELHDALRTFVGVLDGMQAPYAVGGAIAMAFAGHLRGTRDVDVLALVPAIRSRELADALNVAGFRMRSAAGQPEPIDVLRMTESARELGQFRVWWKDTLVEVFVPKVPLQDSVLRRRIQASIQDAMIWITTAEDLILLKMIFHRPKDIEDVRRIIAANRGRLDTAYLQEWMPRTLEPAAGVELAELLRRYEGRA